MSTVQEKAIELAKAVTGAVNRGVKHYHPKTGMLLATPKEILGCLVEQGEVQLEDPQPKSDLLWTPGS